MVTDDPLREGQRDRSAADAETCAMTAPMHRLVGVTRGHPMLSLPASATVTWPTWKFGRTACPEPATLPYTARFLACAVHGVREADDAGRALIAFSVTKRALLRIE